jgi:hypothetical protein
MTIARRAVALLATLTAAWAIAAPAPSFLGPTGLIRIPTTEVAALDQASGILGVYTDASVTVIGVNYGIRPDAEVGFTRTTGPATTLNAKYAWRAENGNKPAVSIGVLDFTDQGDPTLYGVAGKAFVMENPGKLSNLRGYAGLALGGSNDGIFLGGSVQYEENWTAMAEYDTNDINLGVRYTAPKGLMGTVAIIGGGDDIALGASYVKQF